MKSLKQLEKELVKIEEERVTIKASYKLALQNFEKEKSEETKNKLLEFTLKKEKIENDFYELDFQIKRIEELKEVRDKVAGFCFLALKEEESEEIIKLINKAIERWLSK